MAIGERSDSASDVGKCVDANRESRTVRSRRRDGMDRLWVNSRLWAFFRFFLHLFAQKTKKISLLFLSSALPIALPSRVFARGRPQRVAPRSSRTARTRRVLARRAGCSRLPRPEGPPPRSRSRAGSPRSVLPAKRFAAFRASDRARDRPPRRRRDREPASFVRGALCGTERPVLHLSRVRARSGSHARLEACSSRAPTREAPRIPTVRRLLPKNQR